jgi:hypothetical protein
VGARTLATYDNPISGLLLTMSELALTVSGLASPGEKFAYGARLPLAGDELLIVIHRNQPSLAAQRAHLAHMIHVHQGVAVNAPEARVLEAQF